MLQRDTRWTECPSRLPRPQLHHRVCSRDRSPRCRIDLDQLLYTIPHIQCPLLRKRDAISLQVVWILTSALRDH